MPQVISPDRFLGKLDEYLHKNDTDSAKRHLNYWLAEAQAANDESTELLVQNERMGLYRKLGEREEAIAAADAALAKIKTLCIEHQVGSATTYLNAATVYGAFGMAEEGIAFFEHAKKVYERELPASDRRLGGLYNNMGLSLVDLKRFDEAKQLYEKAISVMRQAEHGGMEVAITYLNLATAAEKEMGLVEADETIEKYLALAEELLEKEEKRDGYYAFVCEKCASVFGYYGHFVYQGELSERARRIYEQSRT